MMHEAHDTYDDLMSLKLDGLIEEPDDRKLNEHLSNCAICAQTWALFQEADGILRNSAQEPLPVPYFFHSKVMAQIAAPALQTQGASSKPFFLPGTNTASLGEIPSLQAVGVPALTAAAATGALAFPHAHTRRLPATPTTGLSDNADWQGQVFAYLRNTAAVILSLTGLAALFLALAMSGVIKLGGTFGDGMSTLRTVFEAVGAWFQSAFTTSGSALVAVSAIIAGLLLLVGWQVVAGYQRAVSEGRGHTGALTGALNTGSLEVAA